jgi:hypothetical protein
MFGLSTGTMETHYNLGSAADLILTPDFRILLPGPGTFNFAVSADREGNTCVRSLEGNTAGVILSEMIGDATYEIHANEQAWFRSGRLQNASSVSPIACGCPVQMVPVMRAEESTPATSVKPHAPAETDLIAQAAPQGTAAAVTNRVPASSGRDLHVQVDAPFVFRATQPKVPAAPSVAHLRLLPRLTPEQLEVAPLAPTKIRYYRLQAGKIDKPERRGFFSRLGGVFSAIFR